MCLLNSKSSSSRNERFTLTYEWRGKVRDGDGISWMRVIACALPLLVMTCIMTGIGHTDEVDRDRRIQIAGICIIHHLGYITDKDIE